MSTFAIQNSKKQNQNNRTALNQTPEADSKFNLLRGSLKLMHYDKETGNLIESGSVKALLLDGDKRFANLKLVANEVKMYVEKAQLRKYLI